MPAATVAEEVSPALAEARIAVQEPPAEIEETIVAAEAAPEAIPPPVPAPLGVGVTLRLESERGPLSTFEVTRSGATIGRGPESTIQLADLSVSRKHAKITYKQGAYWLSDLGSMGGTWIDGAKLAAPRRVAAGQTIDIGLCRLTVVAAAEGEKAGAAKGPSNAA
jgi:pSer/pThr/pTyr-binding forkhead associated (FHA) protein